MAAVVSPAPPIYLGRKESRRSLLTSGLMGGGSNPTSEMELRTVTLRLSIVQNISKVEVVGVQIARLDAEEAKLSEPMSRYYAS
jgi:hypothetical protein